MHHNRSMSECLDGTRIIECQTGTNQVVRVRQDYNALFEELFSFSNERPGVPMRQRNLPSSFFQPPPRDSGSVMTGIVHRVPVSHARHTSYDLQGYNSWRETPTLVNGGVPVSGVARPLIEASHSHSVNTSSSANSGPPDCMMRATSDNCNTNESVKEEFVDNSTISENSELLDLDLERDMEKMRKDREDLNRLRSSMQFIQTSNVPASMQQQNQQNSGRQQRSYHQSPIGSNNQLTYLSSTGSSSGSGSILDTIEFAINNSSASTTATSANHLLRPQLPYHHLRQTSVDSGLGFSTSFASQTNKWPSSHHGHTHSVNVIPGYVCNGPRSTRLDTHSTNSVDEISSTSLHNSHSSIVSNCATSTANHVSTNNHVNPSSYMEDMDPDKITPTLPDLTDLNIEEIMSTVY